MEIWSLSMFSHPRLLKCCQAQISPKFLKLEMRKHWQGSNLPKIPEILASMGNAGAIVCSDFWNLGKFDPCHVFAFQASGISGKFDLCRCFRIGVCPPPMIHCLRKAGSAGSWGGGGGGGRRREHIYIYICIYVAHTFRVYLASFLCIQYKMPS